MTKTPQTANFCGMGVVETIITYFVSWWLILFMALPFGARPEVSPEKGHVPSAPANPQIKKKCIITSVLALLPTLLAHYLMG